MRIGLITTIDRNIGDDLVREGICLVFREVFKQEPLTFVAVNKHRPLTVYPYWHPLGGLGRLAELLPRGKRQFETVAERVFHRLGFSRFDGCDLIVQAGAPVLWPKCHQCEWAIPLWYHIVGRLSDSRPVLNLAAGSCYPWERQPRHVEDPRDVQYLRDILTFCRLTITRDCLAQDLCSSLGVETCLFPCSAFLAGRKYRGGSGEKSWVLINYMTEGGHYQWNQQIDGEQWRRVMESLIERLAKRHRLAFLCHNEEECYLAGQLNPKIPRILPKGVFDYFALVSQAKVAVCNRLHACVALAGLGVPSIGVGTDTRLLMLRTIGVPYFYVKELNAALLESCVEDLLRHSPQERERLLVLQSQTFDGYVQKVMEHI